jgi:hypothetical protein
MRGNWECPWKANTTLNNGIYSYWMVRFAQMRKTRIQINDVLAFAP